MNLEAAKAAVTQSLMSSKLAASKAAETLSRAETMPNVQSPSNVPGNSSLLKKQMSISNLILSESFPPRSLSKPGSPLRKVPQAKSPTSTSVASITSTPLSQAPGTVKVMSEALGSSPKPVSPLAEAVTPADKPVSTSSPSTNPSKPMANEQVKSPVPSNPSESGGGNQKQADLLVTKATLSNSGNSVSNSNRGPTTSPDSSSSKGNDLGSTNNLPPNTDSTGGEERQGGKKGRFLQRLRENKVALLTSDAMAQMGCTGFAAKQKEVVSQVCNLL